jgi:hypothetical protein
MAVEGPLDIPESSSTSISLRSAGVHTVVYHTCVRPNTPWTAANTMQAKKSHRKHLESLPSTTYPLEPTNDPAQVRMPETPTQRGEIQGNYPALKGEVDAETVAGAQR